MELCERVDKGVIELNRRVEKGRKIRQFRKNKVSPEGGLRPGFGDRLLHVLRNDVMLTLYSRACLPSALRMLMGRLHCNTKRLCLHPHSSTLKLTAILALIFTLKIFDSIFETAA